VGFGRRIKFTERQQFEVVHRQAQIGVFGLRGGVGVAQLQTFRCAVEALTQGAVFVSVAEFAQQPAYFVRSPPGLLYHPQGGGKRDPARLRILEHAALENAALPRSMRVKPARAIRT
jgi:hypothetical protein